MVVLWCEFVEVENECTSYNFRLFAIFLPKIIRIGGKYEEVMTKTIFFFLRHGVCWDDDSHPSKY